MKEKESIRLTGEKYPTKSVGDIGQISRGLLIDCTTPIKGIQEVV